MTLLPERLTDLQVFQDSACKSIVKKAAVHALVNKDLHDLAEVRALFC